MARKVLIASFVIAVLASVGASSSETATVRGGSFAFPRSCEPMLPIFARSVPIPAGGFGVTSCDVVVDPDQWNAFCAVNGLACQPYDAGFFADWAVVALVVETVSPVICENAGLVPGWAMTCLMRRPQAYRARVELTLAGGECPCSMAPQYPIRLYLVQAVPAGGPDLCVAWLEPHRIECLGP